MPLKLLKEDLWLEKGGSAFHLQCNWTNCLLWLKSTCEPFLSCGIKAFQITSLLGEKSDNTKAAPRLCAFFVGIKSLKRRPLTGEKSLRFSFEMLRRFNLSAVIEFHLLTFFIMQNDESVSKNISDWRKERKTKRRSRLRGWIPPLTFFVVSSVASWYFPKSFNRRSHVSGLSYFFSLSLPMPNACLWWMFLFNSSSISNIRHSILTSLNIQYSTFNIFWVGRQGEESFFLFSFSKSSTKYPANPANPDLCFDWVVSVLIWPPEFHVWKV